jgi:SAM-dependent methyltransferase
MISAALAGLIRCPDCKADLRPGDAAFRCDGCSRIFPVQHGYLDLRPAAAFVEQTKYLDHALHADARHEAIAPPLLGSRIRNDMLRQMLRPGPGDRIIDLGCGSGRALAWNAPLGPTSVGIDISPFFAGQAAAEVNLILGDLRRLPLRDGIFDKAWTLDVLEHLSPAAFRDVLREAHRVLRDDGQLFVYTHVRQNGWPAAGVRAVNALARLCERAGLIDLRQERLRKSDHLNPVATHEELRDVIADCGFELERIVYYTPVVGAFVENVLARMAERMLVRRAERPAAGSPEDHLGDATATNHDAALRTARAQAQRRVARRGLTYRALTAASTVMKLDVWLFGRIPSGPFFALLRKPGAVGREA